MKKFIKLWIEKEPSKMSIDIQPKEPTENHQSKPVAFYYTFYKDSVPVIIPSPIYKDKGSLMSLIKKNGE